MARSTPKKLVAKKSKKSKTKLIGVIHLLPLPGSVLAAEQSPVEALQNAGMQALSEVQILERAGFDGVIVENFGDVPFSKQDAAKITIASMSVIIAGITEATKMAVGVNVLRNDGLAALAMASILGASIIRVNVLSGVVASDQGLIEGSALELMKERARINSEVMVLADVHVKHAKPLNSDDIAAAIAELSTRALADGIILTGPATGTSVSDSEFEKALGACRKYEIPLFIGSGVTASNVKKFKGKVQGIIVGSDLRKGGVAGQPLDAARVKKFTRAFFNRGRA